MVDIKPTFNSTFYHLQTQSKEVAELYVSFDKYRDELSNQLAKRTQIPEANSAKSYELYEKAVKESEEIIERLEKKATEEKEKLRNKYLPANSDLNIMDARAATEYLDGLSTTERRAALAESVELRQLVNRFKSVFGGGKISDLLNDMNQVFIEANKEPLQKIDDLLEAAPHLKSTFSERLKEPFETQSRFSFETSRELYQSQYDEPEQEQEIE
jgi:hypothetical protein